MYSVTHFWTNPRNNTTEQFEDDEAAARVELAKMTSDDDNGQVSILYRDGEEIERHTWFDCDTIRETLLKRACNSHLGEALRKSHERNYETLYVDPDGDTDWIESIDSNEGQWRDGHPVPSLCWVGTGSVPCNCDHCSGDDAVESADDIAFEGDDYEAMREQFQRALDEIPVGYFDDEKTAKAFVSLSAASALEAAKKVCEDIDENWEMGATTFTFEDGSRLQVCGAFVKALLPGE